MSVKTTCGQCEDGLVPIGRCNCGSPADESAGFMHERLCGYEPCPDGCWDRLHPELADGADPDVRYAQLQSEHLAAADLDPEWPG